MRKPYEVEGLCIEKAALVEQVHRVPIGDAFSRMLLMGKIKALQREIDKIAGIPAEYLSK